MRLTPQMRDGRDFALGAALVVGLVLLGLGALGLLMRGLAELIW
jgi:hypothetical protein